MANHKSALKRIRNSERKRERNRVYRSTTRTEVKKARQALASGDIPTSEEAIVAAISQLDKAATKGVIHKNGASRRKSRLMIQLNRLKATQTENA